VLQTKNFKLSGNSCVLGWSVKCTLPSTPYRYVFVCARVCVYPTVCLTFDLFVLVSGSVHVLEYDFLGGKLVLNEGKNQN